MYEERLGTDWEALSEGEAIDRAFALGVASVFGYENREEFARLRAALDSSYDRSIIDLSHREGKQKARELRGKATDRATVWERLVGSDRESAADSPSTPPPHPGAERGPAERRPKSLDRIDLLEGGSSLDALQYPRFLRRPSEDEGA
ncbi:hypothetical protein [Halorarum salinum]|uniref:Uncharacterized protein n=1 Tax=Halorarum salinum TaxID=2743089 RepID=A0A7D5L9B7_9EURY|nr:hypothetical protein [Halobaculum salinum]QLG60749.1 hypothetical protein HUG12_02900 [Halobaculum salinum]